MMTMMKCGAKTRKNTPCEQPAGWGTNHVGEGRCKLHGGKAPQVEKKYELYKQCLMEDEKETFEKLLNSRDLENELAMLRIALMRCMETLGLKHVAPIARAIVALLDHIDPRPKQVEHHIDGMVEHTLDVEVSYSELSEIGKEVIDQLYREAEQIAAKAASLDSAEDKRRGVD